MDGFLKQDIICRLLEEKPLAGLERGEVHSFEGNR